MTDVSTRLEIIDLSSLGSIHRKSLAAVDLPTEEVLSWFPIRAKRFGYATWMSMMTRNCPRLPVAYLFPNLSPCSRVLLVMTLHKEIPAMLRHTIYVATCLPYKATVILCYTMFFDLRILESCKLICPLSSALPAKLLTLWVKIRQLFALASSCLSIRHFQSSGLEQNVATQPKFLSLNNLRRLIKTHYLIHFRSQAY